jgi:hypothetical protein
LVVKTFTGIDVESTSLQELTKSVVTLPASVVLHLLLIFQPWPRRKINPGFRFSVVVRSANIT